MGISVSLMFLKDISAIFIPVILIIEYFILEPRHSIEVEYSFFEGVLDISYIYNKEKRKNKLELNLRNANIIVPTGSSEIRSYHSQKELDISSGIDRKNTYSIIIRMGTELTQVLIEPNEKMLTLFEQALRRGPGYK